MRLTYDGLIVDPCIPSDWKEFTIVRKWRAATYTITVKNPDGVQKGIKSITLNGEKVCNPLKAQNPGTDNSVVVIMG